MKQYKKDSVPEETKERKLRRFSGTDQAFKLLHDAKAYIVRLPNTYECPLAIPWSSPTETMSRDRLEEYSRTVIPQRLIQFNVFSIDKTYHFIDGYLTGIEKSNPFALFGMTRCQIELLAAAYAPISIIRSLASPEPDERSVSRVDRALVNFLYGNHADFFGKFSEIHEELPTIPSTSEEDWKAANILTLIDKATKDSEYKNLRKDYDRLCEYLHPNLLSNFCLTEPFLKDKTTWILISRKGHTVISRAVRATAEIMAEWADATIKLVNSVK